MEIRMANLNNALDNKLLLQYLSAAGQDISSGQPISTNVNQVTQQNIASQNFNKLLNLMLGASVTPDNPMKVSTDGNKFKFDLDMSSAGGGGLSGANLSDANKREAIALMGAGSQTPTTQPQPQSQPSTRPSTPNPLASLSGADLAGLTPEMISQALQFKMGAEQMGQQEYNDYINNLYKMGMLEAQTAPKAPSPLDQPFPVEVPGLGQVTNRQWDSLPKEEQEYAIFYNQAKKLGDEDIMTREEYRNLDPTDREQFLRSAMKDPALMEAAVQLAKAGATTIGEIAGREKAKGELKGQLYFKDPDWVDDLSKHMSSSAVRQKVIQSDNQDLERAKEVVSFIEDKILASGGSIQDVKWAEDGKTMIWTVQWPSGDIEEVRRGIRD